MKWIILGFISCLCTSSIFAQKIWTEADKEFLLAELERTKKEVVDEIKDLTPAQWHFKEDSSRWSIQGIVEHIELQDGLYYREIYVVTKAPQFPLERKNIHRNDSIILNYAVDPRKGKTQWNLEPIGRYYTQEKAIFAFQQTRNHLIDFVKNTDLDIRSYYTYRNYQVGGDLSNVSAWDVRDLHQVLLTTIAHTDRHLSQIKRVKAHPNYPKD